MSFQLTSEQEMIRLMAREFARKELEPFAHAWDAQETFPLEALRKMGGLGLLGMMVPAEYGGAGVGAVSYSLALQEIAYACASTAVTMSVTNLSQDPLLKFGTEAQREKYLVPLAGGEIIGAFAITEPGAGSDPGSMVMRAEDRGNHYRVNGTKVFITNGGYAGSIILVARTGAEKSGRGLTAFIVEPGLPGFSVGRKEDKMGLRASNTVELIFEDCLIPKENLLAKEGHGFRIAMTALDSGRIGIASQSLGIARACLDEAIQYAKSRRQFGRAIGSFQALQWMIADTATEIEAAHWLTLNAADRKDQGLPFTREASMAKLFASEMANRAAYRALQIHGGYGYMKEYKIERLYRDVRVTAIYEGTSEVQRIVIARESMGA
ncbi:MAG: acyl-CoA dehydrogenase family protein [Syntrophales bacterium]|jgi:alkylation response protein AidB-like acyl-CoA dehydrogenase|nr:acyl-CoA dehydrogenase family protein [Syntrophales bacterium]MDD4338187.1 acyl-CoA dehydrogenase family protein [Syntrophales bacterium]HOG07637.1 acyl-CoA dehydrogenase family protein [Syntrophales bacterium]HOS77431.1 acyl-CoA dehydrogenase family protein [Syntrophales bacterium]HPB71154.1 acyl-CoA dehydrogenase family protein [Syntrophales bacterium]